MYISVLGICAVLISAIQALAPDAQVHCLDCTQVANPNDCHKQTLCAPGEMCMAEQYVTEQGHVFYDVGCKLASTCSLGGYVVSDAEIQQRISAQKSSLPVVGRKRQIEPGVVHACEECCESDHCNNFLCGGEVTNSLKCVSCQGVTNMTICNKLEACQPHEVCYIEETVNDKFELLYTSGCIREVQCQAFIENLKLLGGFNLDSCVSCCNDSFCNKKCPDVVIPSTTVCPSFPNLPNFQEPHPIHNPLVTMGCSGREDIVFMVDNSQYVDDQKEHWFELFVKAFVETLTIGPNNSRFGLANYNNKGHNIIRLRDGDVPQNVLPKIERVIDHRGHLVNESDMAAAIHFGANMFDRRHQRPGVAKYLIMLTEDDIEDTKAVINAANQLRHRNITLIILGVGQFTHEESQDLRQAVTSPSNTHLFLYPNFKGLTTVLQDIVLSKCERNKLVPTLPTDPCSGPKMLNLLGCGAKEDVILLLDRSGSISNDDWKHIHDFVHKLVEQFNIAPDASRLGLITFNDNVTEVVHLHEFPNKTALLANIDTRLNALGPQGETYTADALQKALEWYATSGRNDAVKTVVIFTDGGSDTKFGTVAGALELHRRNITVFVIGIGHDVDLREQLILASDPDVEHMINVKDVPGLILYLDYLFAVRCRELASQSTTTLPLTSTTATHVRRTN